MPELLDIEQHLPLLAYLRREGHIAPDETPQFTNLSGGVSSRTVLMQRANGEGWVLKQSLEKLRVATDWFSDPQRVHCEAAALRWLAQLTPPGSVPAFIFEDFTHHVMAMQAVPQPHVNWKVLMLGGGLKIEHAIAFGRLLAAIHRNAYLRFDEVAPDFENCTFFGSLRIEPYYQYTATQVPEVAPFIHALIEDTLPLRLTFVHGDYSPKNVLIYQDQPVLLDYEVAHIGDPAFDLGFSTTHLLSKAHHLPQQRTDFARAAQAYWDTYEQHLGDVPWKAGLQARAVRHTLGCLLARVSGRSPLEYMNADERAHQREVVVSIMMKPPTIYADLIHIFTNRL
ncbi:MAG: phosphotransferase [Anaerolineae bacterium]